MIGGIFAGAVIAYVGSYLLIFILRLICNTIDIGEEILERIYFFKICGVLLVLLLMIGVGYFFISSMLEVISVI